MEHSKEHHVSVLQASAAVLHLFLFTPSPLSPAMVIWFRAALILTLLAASGGTATPADEQFDVRHHLSTISRSDPAPFLSTPNHKREQQIERRWTNRGLRSLQLRLVAGVLALRSGCEGVCLGRHHRRTLAEQGKTMAIFADSDVMAILATGFVSPGGTAGVRLRVKDYNQDTNGMRDEVLKGKLKLRKAKEEKVRHSKMSKLSQNGSSRAQ